MNSRSVARELSFLALGQLSVSIEPEPEDMILAVTRTMREIAKNQLDSVNRDLKVLGDYFFSLSLDVVAESESSEPPSKLPVSIAQLHKDVAKLELAYFTLKEALNLPELLNQGNEVFQYSKELLQSYREHKQSIDGKLQQVLSERKTSNLQLNRRGWSIERIVSTDRSILKIAMAELMSHKDVPPVVVMTEYVKLADKYGTEHSAKFVNGVLADLINHKTDPVDTIPPNTDHAGTVIADSGSES